MSKQFLCLSDEQAGEIRRQLPDDDQVRAAARRMALLGDPTRIRIALVLRNAGELCVGDTATLLGLNIALVSHHVRALAASGLATKERQGKLIRYKLTAPAVQMLAVAVAEAPEAVES